jgi:hypothetical protein
VELDKLGAVLRPRSSWEAVDLGFAMGRTWMRPIYRAWLTTVLPVYALVWAALFDHPSWSCGGSSHCGTRCHSSW